MNTTITLDKHEKVVDRDHYDDMNQMLFCCLMQLKDYSSNQWIMVPDLKDYHINEIELMLNLDERTIFDPDECPERVLKQWKIKRPWLEDGK